MISNVEVQKCVCSYTCVLDKGLALHSNISDADLGLRSNWRATWEAARARGW